MCTEILLQPEDRELSTGGELAALLSLTAEQVATYLPHGGEDNCLCNADMKSLAAIACRERLIDFDRFPFGEIWRAVTR